jgi:hypothetical protein
VKVGILHHDRRRMRAQHHRDASPQPARHQA